MEPSGAGLGAAWGQRGLLPDPTVLITRRSSPGPSGFKEVAQVPLLVDECLGVTNNNPCGRVKGDGQGQDSDRCRGQGGETPM